MSAESDLIPMLSLDSKGLFVLPKWSKLKLVKPLLLLFGLSSAMTFVTMPLSIYLDARQGIALCVLAGATCFAVGVIVLSLPLLFPVVETYVLVVAIGCGVRMTFPLIACGILMALVGVDEAHVFATCLLVISPVLLFFETWYWTRRLAAMEESR